MHFSEYSESVEEIVHVEDNDKSIHLILLDVIIGVMHQFDISFFNYAHVVIVKNSINVIVICELRQIELCKEN